MDNNYNYISPDQQELNLQFFMDKLNKPNLSYKELVEIRKTVFDEQSTKEGKFYFFPKGGSKQFWDRYREVKAEIVNKIEADKELRERTFNEIMGLIEEANNLRELNSIKNEIYNNQNLYFKSDDGICKQVLFSLTNEKIGRLAA